MHLPGECSISAPERNCKNGSKKTNQGSGTAKSIAKGAERLSREPQNGIVHSIDSPGQEQQMF